MNFLDFLFEAGFSLVCVSFFPFSPSRKKTVFSVKELSNISRFSRRPGDSSSRVGNSVEFRGDHFVGLGGFFLGTLGHFGHSSDCPWVEFYINGLSSNSLLLLFTSPPPKPSIPLSSLLNSRNCLLKKELANISEPFRPVLRGNLGAKWELDLGALYLGLYILGGFILGVQLGVLRDSARALQLPSPIGNFSRPNTSAAALLLPPTDVILHTNGLPTNLMTRRSNRGRFYCSDRLPRGLALLPRSGLRPPTSGAGL